mgnify:FL=1
MSFLTTLWISFAAKFMLLRSNTWVFNCTCRFCEKIHFETVDLYTCIYLYLSIYIYMYIYECQDQNRTIDVTSKSASCWRACMYFLFKDLTYFINNLKKPCISRKEQLNCWTCFIAEASMYTFSNEQKNLSYSFSNGKEKDVVNAMLQG